VEEVTMIQSKLPFTYELKKKMLIKDDENEMINEKKDDILTIQGSS
jgi:hypothetical protein